MAIGKNCAELERALGYTFTHTEYLETALTHSSYANEQRDRGGRYPSNERMEFLGDAVLEIVISEYLYTHFSEYAEGSLSILRKKIVCRETLARVADTLSLGAYIHLGNGEESAQCRASSKVLANAMEAVLAAVYLDAVAEGKPYTDVILSLFRDELEGTLLNPFADAKTELQQLVEKDGASVLEYEVIKEEGPMHKRTFTVVARINNNDVGQGTASTKKDAEMEAARVALSLFGVHRD